MSALSNIATHSRPGGARECSHFFELAFIEVKLLILRIKRKSMKRRRTGEELAPPAIV